MSPLPKPSLAAPLRRTTDLTENIPVGTYVVHVQPDGTPRFSFVSSQWLQLCGLTHEAFMANQGLAIEVIHPDDRERMLEDNRQALAAGIPFRWEGRLLVQGQVRWVTIESNPRLGDDGLMVWEGVMYDISARKQVEARLLAAEQRQRRLIEHLPVPVAVASLTTGQAILYLNRQFERQFGYTLKDIPTVADWARLAYPDPTYREQSFAWWDATVAQAVSGDGLVQAREFRIVRHDGVERNVIISATVVDDTLVTSFNDITDHLQAERALQSAQEALQKTAYEITEAIPVGTYTMVLKPGDSMASFSFMSRRFLELTGLTREEAQHDVMKAFACVHPDDLDAWVTLNAQAFAQKQPFFGQTRVVVQGQVRWITAESVPRDLPDGTTVWEGVLTDVTQRVQAEESLKQMATTDPLTGTLNRRAFEQAIEREQERLQRYGEPLSLLLFDIDHFKAINDTHGHLVGDQVLITLSIRVQEALRAVDLLARWGGEEFAVLLPHCDRTQARAVADKLCSLIEATLFEQAGRITASFGVTQFQLQDSLDSALRRVDDALYQAKASGRNQVYLI